MAAGEGFDLRCGGGQVAALECPRHSIHYRSRSNPRRESKQEDRHKDGPLVLAAGEGFEPSHTESESAVLPLHNPAKRKSYYTKKTLFVKGLFCMIAGAPLFDRKHARALHARDRFKRLQQGVDPK